MAKSKLSALIEKFDTGDIDYDNLKEVDIDTEGAKSVQMVPIDSCLAEQLELLARAKKTSVNKILDAILKKNLPKLKAA